MIISQDRCLDDPLAGQIYADNISGGTWACGSYLGVDGSKVWVRPPPGMPPLPPLPTDGILMHAKTSVAIRLSQVTDGARIHS